MNSGSTFSRKTSRYDTRSGYPAQVIVAPLPMPYPTRMQPARPYLLLLILLLGLVLLAWVTSREPRPGLERGAIRYRQR
jgi:hypothetical protein